MSRPSIRVECVKYFVSKQYCLLFLVNFNQLLDADYFCPQCRRKSHQNRTAITNVVAINFRGAVFCNSLRRPADVGRGGRHYKWPCSNVVGFYFYRAMLCIRGTSHGPVSVHLSQVGVPLKRLNIGSQKQYRTGTLVF